MSMTPKKVLLVGPVLSQSGYGEHARCVLRSLMNNIEKFDIYIQPVDWGKTSTDTSDTPENKFIIECIKRTAQYQGEFDLSLQVGLPLEWKPLAKKNIGLTAAVETDRCNPKWIEVANQIEKMVVVSDHAGRSFTNHSYPLQDQEGNSHGFLKLHKPYTVIGYPVKNYKDTGFANNLDLPEKCFLSVSQAAPRKNWENMIKWFVEEFRNEDVGLLLKMNYICDSLVDREALKKHLRSILKNVDEDNTRKCKVLLLHGRLNEDDLHSLYTDPRMCAYITTTHGEGYGLPVFEAAYSGLPVVAPNWSGYLDFLRGPVTNEKSGKTKTKSLFSKVKYELVEVEKHALMEEIIIPGSRWASVSGDDFKKKIRSVYTSPSLPKKEAAILKEYLLTEYTEEKIYKKYMDCISTLIPELRVEESLDDNEFAVFEIENND